MEKMVADLAQSDAQLTCCVQHMTTRSVSVERGIKQGTSCPSNRQNQGEAHITMCYYRSLAGFCTIFNVCTSKSGAKSTLLKQKKVYFLASD
jgi:hypothetical protein